jgi:hypothetical protein
MISISARQLLHMHDPDSNRTLQNKHLLGSSRVNRFSGAMPFSSGGIKSLKYEFIGKI